MNRYNESPLWGENADFRAVSKFNTQRRIHGGGAGGDPPPIRLGPKKFIAQPKNRHICKPPFACQNVLKLIYSNQEFQNFPREDPGPPLQGEGRKGKGGEERDGKGKKGRDRGE